MHASRTPHTHLNYHYTFYANLRIFRHPSVKRRFRSSLLAHLQFSDRSPLDQGGVLRRDDDLRGHIRWREPWQAVRGHHGEVGELRRLLLAELSIGGANPEEGTRKERKEEKKFNLLLLNINLYIQLFFFPLT